jgi:6-phosphogluconolactonase
MKSVRFYPAILGVAVLLASGCGGGSPAVSVRPSPACVPATNSEVSYVLTGYQVYVFSVNSCTGQFTARTPASIGTGYSSPQQSAEEMVSDPPGRFAYVANHVSNASDLSRISMYTINSTTGILTTTAPATVPTGWFPQQIAIDPKGRFVYTANTDDSTVSMFTIDQSTGVLTPTTPTSVSTLVPGQLLSQPNFLTVDPSGRFLYVTVSLSDGAAVLMYNIDQTTGLLTPTSPATVYACGWPWQVVIAPSGKFAYVVNNFAGGPMTAAVWQYTVNPDTGVLTPHNPVAVAAGNGPTGIAVDPTSRFAYVVNRQDNNVSMYTIDPNAGNLALNVSASNSNGVVAAGAQPFRIAFDRSGKFVYVTNEEGAVSIYTVNSDGTLASAGMTGTSGLATAFTLLNP